MELIRAFTGLTKGDADIAGGKGASLGEMTKAGISVPPGFVILSTAFNEFLKEADLIQEIESILGTVKYEQMHTVEDASEKIQSLILNAKLPSKIAKEIEKHFRELNTTYVAVRSSATAEDGAEHAWAGQLDSYLNTTEADLLEKVQHCWASLFTPRAIFYRFEKSLDATDISVAVVVQKMVESEVSGIAFSVHPVTEDRNQLIIEAGYGLGEAIVSGQITPDSYVVEKEPRRILDKNVYAQSRGIYRVEGGGSEWKDIVEPQASAQVLMDEQILELSELVLKIEAHYGFPCDIEWAFEQGVFYIVQSRPITTLSESSANSQKQQFFKAYTRDFSIIMQEAWFYANKDGFTERLGLSEYPHNPPYIYFMRDGVEEVWENKKGNEWLYERLSERLESDPDFFPTLYKRYFEELAHIKEWWKKEITTLEELKAFLKKVFPATSDFVLMYGATLSESLPPDQQKLANEFRNKDTFFAECNTTIEKALKTIYPELGALALYITKEELGIKIDAEELKRRDNGFVLIPGIFLGTLSFGDLQQRFSEYEFKVEKFDPNVKTLTGQTGYAGKVTGKVRIIKRKDQVDQVQEGEIIVSPMTTPEMVAGMKRAAAFVTDEGGITCHAAIIAREMKKPCIIGTKVATQILKNGDEIEVDADSGTVRIQRRYHPSFEKVFARDFCMIALEIAALSEKREDKEWMIEPNPYKPYMLIERTDGTCNIWYNKKGVEWTNETLFQRVKADKDFLKTVEKQVREGVGFIRPLYEKQEAIDKDSLIRFIGEFLKSYSWIEAMWWIKSMESEDIGPGHEDIVKLREETETLSAGTEIVIRKSLEKLYPELGILSSMIRLEELRSDTIPPKEELQKRLDGFTLIDGELELKTLDEVAIENDLILEKNAVDFETTEIKGEIAYRGKVRGSVCRVMGHTDFGKIKEGEILVSPMTMVDFLPEMKKAAAFVTDEGGITCHAAIVAREMKKPCLIGTQVATAVLNDGDEVEVDADSGVVRILKSSRLSPDDYIRMFANKSFYYLFTDVFLSHYRALGVICAQDGDTWMSFLPKTSEVKTLKDGAKLYTSEKDYSAYKAGFEDYIRISSDYFETQLKKEKLSQKEVKDFFTMAAKHFSFYSKTEFFYTDKIDQEKMVPTVQEFDELKLNGRAHLNKVLFEKYVPGLITKLAEQYLVPKEHLFKYSVAEVIALSGGAPALSNEEVGKRNILFAGEDQTIFGDKALNLVHAFHASYRELSNMIKGTVAFKGKVRGKARVLVPDFSDFSKIAKAVEEMEKGEILVTETTAPEVIAACKKAAAIITNQGGMLSHAAIIARELKIPCIIGTDKDVVLNIQTGDELEVDADNGVIRILKSHPKPEYQEIEFIKNTYLLDVYTLERAWSDAAKRTDLNLVPLEVVLVFKDGALTLYCDNTAWQENARRAFSALAASAELRRARSERARDYITKIQELIAQIKTAEYASLAEAHTLIQDALYECMLSFSEENFPGLHSSLLTDELHHIVPDSELAADLLNAKRQSYFQKYEFAFLAIASQIEKQQIVTPLTFENLPTDIQDNIESLITTYGWISAGFNEKAKDVTSVITEINELLAAGIPVGKIEQERVDQFTIALEKREQAESKLQKELPESEWTKVALIQALIEEAKYRIEFGLELIYVSRFVYEKIAGEYGFSLAEIKYLYPNEITELLEEKCSVAEAKGKIESRQSGEFVVSIRDGVCRELDTFIPPKKEETVLKGQKAYGGIVRGVVRIVNSPEDNHKVTAGDILVSSRTSPELVPAMAKAGAIVSELGGMLCHAAIVSREMKKTCLVGVKRATELLKDGDIVEVNADTGVIEIVKE